MGGRQYCRQGQAKRAETTSPIFFLIFGTHDLMTVFDFLLLLLSVTEKILSVTVRNCVTNKDPGINTTQAWIM